MKYSFHVVAAIAFLLSGVSDAAEVVPPVNAPSGWKMTFDDEFDTLDMSRYETHLPQARFIGGQGEKEIYVDRMYAGDGSTPLNLNPFSVKDGVLTIRADRPTTAIRQHLEGQQYTSGMLTTRHSFSQLYGYFEMRAKLPLGKGLWPAFWLCAIDLSWPPEIDVMESLGHNPTTLYTTVHMGQRDKPDKIGFATQVADTTTDFHTYGMLWSPTVIAWYFDGKRVAYTPTPPDVRKAMYMLINLAVGGDWPGDPDASMKFPADMQLDYVRVYALPSSGRL